MNRKFIVTTHLGTFTTVAASEKKAIANIRFRLYGRCAAPWETEYWTARVAE